MPMYWPTSTAIWQGWNTNSSLTGSYSTWPLWVMSASNSANQLVWQNWTTSAASTAGTIMIDYGAIWQTWVTSGTVGVTTHAPHVPAPMTDEEREAWEATQQRLREEAETRRHEAALRAQMATRERERARRRAAVLLGKHLSRAQREQLKEHDYFELLVGEHRYRVHRGWSGNVRLLDEQGRETRSFCIHPAEDVPHEDNMLAQKLLLEQDEAAFIRIANATNLHVA